MHYQALVLARTSYLSDADLVPVMHLPLAGCQCALTRRTGAALQPLLAYTFQRLLGPQGVSNCRAGV